MINPFEVIETIKMVDEENLDIRTITMGISLKSCAGPDVDTVCEKVYEKITTYAKDLVKTGEDIEAQFGIPIINKRISVTPIATLVDALEEPTVEKCVKIAKTLDKAAKKTGVNFIGGYTALVHKDYTNGERILIESIPEALAATDLVCSSVNVGSTRAGINMDAVKQMGQIVKRAAELTADTQGFACAKLVVFCNAVEDNPFMAGAFLGEGEGECVINVGVSGPGVVKCALEKVKGVASVDNGIGAVSPEIKVTVDKSKAAEKGLTVAQVYQQVAAAISTEKNAATLTNDDGNDMNVVVVKDDSETVTPKNLRDIDITYKDSSGNEKTIKLSSVSDISKSETMDKISRENQKRYLTISAEVKDGYTLTSVSNNVKSAMNDYKLPKSCSIDYAGTDEMTMEAVSQLMLMLLLGIILIYLIMVAQFQSLKSPFIIMFTIPLAFTGGFLALLITGFDISVVSLVGFVMLCGIIVNNGIVLVDYINKLRIDGKERIESIVEAGKTRMRPILITALTTVLGLVVMALGIGTGAEMMQPIAIVCIGGLLYATFMTLYIVPVIYDLFNKKELKKVSDEDLEFIDE